MSTVVQPRSTFKYLLAGLLVSLLVLNSGALPTRHAGRHDLALADSGAYDLSTRARVGAGGKPKTKVTTPAKGPAVKVPVKKPPVAGPVKKPQVQPKPGKGGPAKPPATAAEDPKTGNKACPVRKPSRKNTRSLYPRALTTHPSATGSASLFHGVSTQAVADSQKAGIDLSKTDKEGEYHGRGGLCDGGFYLTDSIFAAAQFICYRGDTTKPTTAYVNEYTWTPPTGIKHKAYADINESMADLLNGLQNCQKYDILEGPMDGGDFGINLHKDFWQYAVVNQKAVDGLAFAKQHVIPCANVTPGKDIDSSYYQNGQKTSANFLTTVNALEGKC